MSDREFGGKSSKSPSHSCLLIVVLKKNTGNDDLSLPKGTLLLSLDNPPCYSLTMLPLATVQKIITDILPPSSGQSFARDARDLLIECCVEFITLISSEANDISEKEAKKTIAVEHIEKALTDLGFQDYVPDVLAVADEFKDQQKVCKQCGNFLGCSY